MANITRRDFINGSAVTIAGSMAGGFPRLALGSGGAHYPPALTGLRGSHPGSNTVAHQRAWNPAGQALAPEKTGEHYDLVIVGAGLSGLAAAVFYRQQHGPDKSILILDNHDDFGGHAKRNEHAIDGKRLITYGGSQTLVEPRGEQYKEARYRMLGRQFSDYEAEIREHLGGMLSSKHFDFERDVASLTVNRWAHGYAVAGPGDSAAIGRQPHGRITIANSDSAPAADAIEAMRMGHRAVEELRIET